MRLVLLRQPILRDPSLAHETEIGLTAARAPPRNRRNGAEDSKAYDHPDGIHRFAFLWPKALFVRES
jgi:hypothetical protein